MAVRTRDKNMKANLKERISNIYENTKFTFRNSGKKNTQAAPTIVYMNNDPQEEYDEVTVSTCNQMKPSSTSRKKSKPNNYTSWNDRKTLCSNTSVKGVYENAQRASIELPTHASKLPTQVTIKWKFLSIIALIFCICLITALVSLVILIFQQKVSPCEGIGCLYNGTCSVHDDEIVCSCFEGFSGAKCEVTPCENVKCENSGECFLQNLKPKCSCRNGFSGDDCSVTPCSSSPCMNYGSCIYRTDSPDFECTCPPGFSGRYCEVTPCTSLPCKNSGMCTVKGSRYECSCVDGFVGENCTDLHCSFEKLNDPNCVFFLPDLSGSSCNNWIRRSGSTPTSYTGPSRAYNGSYYLYFKSSSYSCVSLASRYLKLDSGKCLTFHYHMYGSDIGYLRVYIDNSSKWIKFGNHVNNWLFGNVSLHNTVSQIKFLATRIGGYGDIAIDDIKIGPCQ